MQIFNNTLEMKGTQTIWMKNGLELHSDFLISIILYIMHGGKLIERGISLEKAQKAVILIHGRGASAEDILSLSDFFTYNQLYIAAPEAQNNTWYPYSFLAHADQNQPWLDGALQVIQNLVSNIEQYLPTENIYLMGFSQGACLVSEASCRNARKYGGIAVLTGGLIGQVIDTSNYSGNFENTPVYLSNGDNDPHIPLGRTHETQNILEQMGATVKKEIFPGRDHIVSKEEIEQVCKWFEL